MKYPPVDPDFYKVDASRGMSEEEITEDWHSFIDGLNEFNYEVDSRQLPSPEPKKFSELAKDIIAKLMPEGNHANSQKS